eukprot:880354-Rhodomonas_salina.2
MAVRPRPVSHADAAESAGWYGRRRAEDLYFPSAETRPELSRPGLPGYCTATVRPRPAATPAGPALRVSVTSQHMRGPDVPDTFNHCVTATMLKSFRTGRDDLFQPTSSQFQQSQELQELLRRAERSNKMLNAKGKALVGQAAKVLRMTQECRPARALASCSATSRKGQPSTSTQPTGSTRKPTPRAKGSLPCQRTHGKSHTS